MYFCDENSNNQCGVTELGVTCSHKTQDTGQERKYVNMSVSLAATTQAADWLLALSNSKAIISQFIPLSGSEQDTWGTSLFR